MVALNIEEMLEENLREPFNSLGETLQEIAEGGATVAENTPAFVGGAATALALGYVTHTLWPQLAPLGSMSTEKAVTVGSIVGGVGGVAYQFAMAANLESLSREVHLLELGPAIFVSLLGSWAAAELLTPPRPNPGTIAVDAMGFLPE